MSTWGQLRLLLQTQFPGVDLDTIDGSLNSRYEQVLEAAEWTGVKGKATLVTTAAYQSTTDTVTLTVGSQVVTGLGTVWDGTQAGKRFYRPGDNVIYNVQGVTDTTHLMLERPYEGHGVDPPGTIYAGSAYAFMQHVYGLPLDCGSVLQILSPTNGFPLQRFSEPGIDRSAGTRALVGDPVAWDTYDDSDGIGSPAVHQVEFYPPPLYARGMLVSYIRAAIGFDGQNTSGAPAAWVSNSVLLYGCRADIAAHLKDYAGAKLYELKFDEELARLLRVELLQRQPIGSFQMASRFTRHRLARAARGSGGWRGGTPGGSD